MDFNLTALLKLSDLNMRCIANEDRKLTAGKYFELLSSFLTLAPNVSESLSKFSDKSIDTENWKSVEAMVSLLNELHCDVFIPDLYAISTAYGKGDYRLAAFHAKKIEQDFNEFHSKIIAAEMVNEPDSFPQADVTLLSCIKVLDEGEANRKLLVLTVDDSPAILEAVSAVLNNDYKVFKLPKPTMLVNVLRQVTPELFLLDYQMPELNGFELIPIIRDFKEHHDTPIIFLTSEGTVDNLTAAIGMGACDFIVKPFNPDLLKEKVAKHIVRKNNLM
jgi:CheY-like chemotaxis protein